MIGRVVSTKVQNTATVLVERTVKHPLYKKTYLQTKKYLVDTGSLEIKEGDVVDFIACKPVSKRKAFKVNKVLGRDFAEIAKGHLKTGAEEAISEVMPEEKESEQVAVDSEQPKAETANKKEKPKKVEKSKKETK